MKRAVYVDGSNGISGDMFVGALLDLGENFAYLESELAKLNMSGFHIQAERLVYDNEMAIDFDVVLTDKHSMGNLNFYQIEEILLRSDLSDYVKETSRKVFKIAAEAGSAAHRTSLEKFLFHEKGALDSLADIVGTSICLDYLGINELYFGTIVDGSGSITLRNQKRLPVPVPAVRQIMKHYPLEFASSVIQGELVTPTGAALAAGLQSAKAIPSDYLIERTGRGKGKRAYNPRALLEIHQISYEEKSYERH